MTIEEMNDKIGKATYEAFNRSFEQHFPLSAKSCPWSETMFQEQWIAAGCAARNVILHDVTESPPPTSRSLKTPCAICGEMIGENYFLSNEGRFMCLPCSLKMFPQPEPTPSGTPSPS